MTNKIGGYKQSSGNIHVQPFSSSATIKKMGSSNSSNTYIIPEYTPISDQLTLNSCAANATADAFEMIKGIEDQSKVKQLSRLLIYWNARVYDNMTNVDDGCYIHNALNSLTILGVCEESLWPYDITKVYAQPPIVAYKQGNDNTIDAFYQIVSQGIARCDDIENAVRSNHPVIFGTQVDATFESYNSNEIVFGPPSNPKGGHAMIITGVRINSAGEREFYIRNSWGNGWGLYGNGHAWMSASYITSSMTSDLFVPTLMSNLLV
jgi:C1A family cysteine protease